MNQTSVYLQKKLRVIVPPPNKTGIDSRDAVLTIDKNLQALGFTLSRRLARALAKLSKSDISALYNEIVAELRTQKGAHVTFRPMYPNFPAQVMEMSEAHLYWNALFHYITLENPNQQHEEDREPLSKSEGQPLLMLDLGSQEDYEAILTELAGANASLSATDKEILAFLLCTLPNRKALLPRVIPQRETLAIIGAHLLHENPAADLTQVAHTATDVLRVLTQISGGDISLAERTKYKKVGRPTRKALLAALEDCGAALEEDMLRHKSKWLRVGEILHPKHYAKRFPRAAAAFAKLREGEHIPTFASETEAALAKGDSVEKLLELLSNRPGEFLRRLDHVLRRFPDEDTKILAAFAKVAERCATPALLGLHTHFAHRKEGAERAVFPKGSTAKMKVIAAPKDPVRQAICKKAVATIEEVLKARFSKLPTLGKVYIDPTLKNYPVPFAQRSASKTLRALPRGSRAPIEGKGETLRFFIHWKNAGEGWDGRVDLDLSAAFLKEDFTLQGQVAYYNLREVGGCHSGDITNAPDGAAEFIDVSIPRLLEQGVRYVAATVTSYTGQPYRSLPECFCGWMLRDKTQQGEIFDARTVVTKSDLCGDTRFVVPVLIDLKTREAIWIDLGMKSNPGFVNCLEGNKKSLSLLCKAIVELSRPNIHTLLRLHGEARGEIVEIPKLADTAFGPELAYEGIEIASKFLAEAEKKPTN